MTGMTDLLFAPAFTLWGAPTTWLELAAVAVSLAMVGCNIRELHWGWPLGAIAALMYLAIFWRDRLYGDASLQVYFIAASLWGWREWLRGRRPDGTALRIERLGRRGWALTLGALALLWPACALFLLRFTDSTTPWSDGFVTAGSILGQVLLGRKYIENWLAWGVVDVASVALFIYKGLWPTVVLYVLFVGLCVVGWREWRLRLGATS